MLLLLPWRRLHDLFISKRFSDHNTDLERISTCPRPSHSSTMASYLITGSSRGLGLAMASRLASLPKSDVSAVFATARQDNSSQLRQLVNSSSGRVGFVPLDVTDERSAVDAAGLVEQQLQGRGLDVLINNAGVMPLSRQGLERMYVGSILDSIIAHQYYRDNLNETFDINVSGAHRVTRAFLPLVRRGQRRTVANM